jgi:hypothetical protein
MNPSRARRGLLLLLSAGILSCSEPTEECTGDVDISVGGSSLPSFSWAPNCAVSGLIVVDGAEGSQWEINARVHENAIESPVRYGDVPARARETAPPTPLLRPNTYIVRAYRLTPIDNGSFLRDVAGEEIFPW